MPGRAALRRRRTAIGAGALATLLVVGGLGWAVQPGSGTRAVEGQVASNPAAPSSDALPRTARVGIHRVSDSSLDERWAELRGQTLDIAQDAEVGDWVARQQDRVLGSAADRVPGQGDGGSPLRRRSVRGQRTRRCR